MYTNTWFYLVVLAMMIGGTIVLNVYIKHAMTICTKNLSKCKDMLVQIGRTDIVKDIDNKFFDKMM